MTTASTTARNLWYEANRGSMQPVPSSIDPYEGLGALERINAPSLRQLQDAFLERFLCSDRAVPADLEAARYWRSGAH